MLFPIVPSYVSPYATLIDHSGAQWVASPAGYTVLTKINGSLITRGGTTIRLVFESAGINCTFNNVTIGPAVTSGSAWNCTSVTAVTQGGNAAWSISGPLGTLHVSDEISFSVTAGVSYIVGVNLNANVTSFVIRSNVAAGVTDYYKPAVQEADDATRGSGYNISSNESYHKRIEIK